MVLLPVYPERLIENYEVNYYIWSVINYWVLTIVWDGLCKINRMTY